MAHSRGRPARPKRGWIGLALREAPPCPWPGCPDMVAVVRDSPLAVRRCPPAWHVGDGWAPGQPGRLTIAPTLPDALRMT
eukprot:8217279-Pyramimonas_sp.AAC.1